jgi:hypothetical protein
VHVGLVGRVLEVYNSSLTKGPFFACMIVACLTVPAALGMEWRSVKEGIGPPSSEDRLTRYRNRTSLGEESSQVGHEEAT